MIFLMVNADLIVGNDDNTKQLCQKRDINHHKVTRPNKGTAYLKIFHQNIRGLGEKAGELLSHRHPGFPHVLCLTELHIKYLQSEKVHMEYYNLGAHYCSHMKKVV